MCAHLAAMSQSHVHRMSDPMHVVIVYDLSYTRYNGIDWVFRVDTVDFNRGLDITQGFGFSRKVSFVDQVIHFVD
jgi:hypothetical protein